MQSCAIDALFEKLPHRKPFFIERKFQDRVLTLYGGGESAHWFVEIVQNIYGFKPKIVLDRKFKSGDVFHDCPAASPLTYHPDETEKKGIVIVSVGSKSLYDAIRIDLQKKGYENILYLHEIYEIHNPFLLPHDWHNNEVEFFRQNRAMINAAFARLEDQESRDVYLAVLETHMMRRPINVTRRPREEQYFPNDILLHKGPRSFVTCGAYDGDSLRLLKDRVGKVDEIVAFEADPTIFSRLSAFLAEKAHELADRVLALPCALIDQEKIAPFTKATGLGSRLHPDGPLTVQCVSLDHILPTFKPTYITMDIEGAEPLALKGARRLLQTHRPDLAICAYHSVDHLWSLLHQIDELDLGYKFYLRNYTSFCIETVLYATCPNEK